MSLTRSLLSVPGHREAMHAKALTSDADIIMFDLEDAVPLDQKEKARQQVIRTLSSIGSLSPAKTLAVRINDLSTPFALRDALEIGQNPKGSLSFIVLPKVNHEGDIHFLDRLFTGIELENRAPAPLRIEAAIETAQGLERSAAMGKALGCNGKWVIHPDQIAPVNQIFSPSPEEIERADRILQAAASASGQGAVAVDGKMVDQATINLARQIRSQADALASAGKAAK